MSTMLSRRAFVAMCAFFPSVAQSRAAKTIPVGLEMFSVRNETERAPEATVRSVAGMGYECVEFYSVYYDWTEAETKRMRTLLDDLGLRCVSTHNDRAYLAKDKIHRTRDRNLILGSRYVVHADSDSPPATLDGWKPVAAAVNAAADELRGAGLGVGYHNEEVEFRPLQGRRPIEIIAAETEPTVMLQLDVGTCLEAGSDPAQWIRANPGRIRSLHCKDWSPNPAEGYKALFGEGVADWGGIFAAAETVGGAEYYLIEQEGSRFPELETARRCLESYRKTRS